LENTIKSMHDFLIKVEENVMRHYRENNYNLEWWTSQFVIAFFFINENFDTPVGVMYI